MFDVTGYFVDGAGGATYYPIDAARVLDSRVANGLSGPFAVEGRADAPGDRPRARSRSTRSRSPAARRSSCRPAPAG